MKTQRTAAFTIIELLIVIGIIAVLAAIATPNFLESQTRSKVARLKADSRAMATAIEIYPPGAQVDPAFIVTDFNTEAYDSIVENPFKGVAENPLSTFSIDVDTASYALLRRQLNNGSLPPKNAVRIEEMINYFSYDYPQPQGETPFAVDIEIAAAPWKEGHKLAKIGLKGKEIDWESRPKCNIVFLLDVSGSMYDYNKLPLLKKSLKLMIDKLDANDRVAIAVYAGASGLVLDSTRGNEQKKILSAIDNLTAGGSTNGGEGIKLAYKIAKRNYIEGGVNRVILATDGDFNVGITNQADLIDLIEKKAQEGVFLSVLGYGMGNYKDSTLEKIADKGNGNYAYIDSFHEARKVMGEQLSGTILTIAKDVKIQVEFNPALVSAYRLIGYENRMLEKEDFNDDKKDAGEIGAGHTVTALYEIVPAGASENISGSVDPLKYQKVPELSTESNSSEIMTVKLRYKEPDEDKSKLLTYTVEDNEKSFADASADFKFAASVAGLGMLLRESEYKGSCDFDMVRSLAKSCIKVDKYDEYKTEFIKLVKTAETLKKKS